MAREELVAIDAYVASWCRRTAAVERVGPFEVFVEPPPFWPKYSRPVLGADVRSGDVEALVQRRLRLGLPLEIEHIEDLHPGLSDRLEALGWSVLRVPLLRLDGAPPDVGVGAGIVIRFVGAEDPDLPRIDAIGHVSFAWPGMEVAGVGSAALDAASSLEPASTRERLRRGDSVMVVACVDGEPVSIGSHLPDPATSASEIVGVATLPAFRRRGLGRAVTAVLAADARARGIEHVWLSAADLAVAGLYEGVGFRRIGTASVASLAGPV